jgi:hypothetical protein
MWPQPLEALIADPIIDDDSGPRVRLQAVLQDLNSLAVNGTATGGPSAGRTKLASVTPGRGELPAGGAGRLFEGDAARILDIDVAHSAAADRESGRELPPRSRPTFSSSRTRP